MQENMGEKRFLKNDFCKRFLINICEKDYFNKTLSFWIVTVMITAKHTVFLLHLCQWRKYTRTFFTLIIHCAKGLTLRQAGPCIFSPLAQV